MVHVCCASAQLLCSGRKWTGALQTLPAVRLQSGTSVCPTTKIRSAAPGIRCAQDRSVMQLLKLLLETVKQHLHTWEYRIEPQPTHILGCVVGSIMHGSHGP